MVRKLLLDKVGVEGIRYYDAYRKNGGYRSVEKALKTVECLGACGYAPMMQLGKNYREHLTKEKVDAVIDECRRNAAERN